MFAVLAVVFVLRRAMEYSFIQPGREMLWRPLDRETKYKTKNTVDVPVYRASDAISAQLNNLIASVGFGAGAVVWFGAGVAAAWALLSLWLARRYEIGGDAGKGGSKPAEAVSAQHVAYPSTTQRT
jgi:ATP:ADP antiporter, AAA family